MAKLIEGKSENLQNKLDDIIERTKVQNKLLNKILDEIKVKETGLDMDIDSNIKGKK